MPIGLSPALPISTEPKGIPALEAPPGEGVNVEVVDGALLPGAAAHIPDSDVLPVKDEPLPTAIPPPSYGKLDISDDELPDAEHVTPLLGIPAVPTSAGLIPGEASSVAPKGMPVGDSVEFGVMPSGEVTPMPEGTVPIGTCASAGVPLKSAANIAAISSPRIVISRVLMQTCSPMSTWARQCMERK